MKTYQQQSLELSYILLSTKRNNEGQYIRDKFVEMTESEITTLDFQSRNLSTESSKILTLKSTFGIEIQFLIIDEQINKVIRMVKSAAQNLQKKTSTDNPTPPKSPLQNLTSKTKTPIKKVQQRILEGQLNRSRYARQNAQTKSLLGS